VENYEFPQDQVYLVEYVYLAKVQILQRYQPAYNAMENYILSTDAEGFLLQGYLETPRQFGHSTDM